MSNKFTSYSGHNGHVRRHLNMTLEPRTYALPADRDLDEFTRLLHGAALKVIAYGIAQELSHDEMRELLSMLGIPTRKVTKNV